MSEYRNPLNGTPGSAVTHTNGGGDAWSATIGGAMTYVASPAFAGQAAAVGATGTIGYLLRQLTATGRVRAVTYVRVPAMLPTTPDVILMRTYTPTAGSDVAGGAALLRGAGGATPSLVLQTRGSGSYIERWYSQAVPWDTWIRVELDLDPGTSPTTGAARLRWYLGDSTTSQGDSGWIAGIDTAASDGRYGDVRHGTVAGVIIDHIGVRDGADAQGDAPWPSNTSPTLTLPGAQTAQAGQGWSVTALATDDGAIAGYDWAVERLTGTGRALVTSGLSGHGGPTLTGDGGTTVPGSVLTVTCTVTDDHGATATATTEVRVPAPGATSVLGTDGTGDPGWTVEGSAPTTGAALADGDPSTAARSPELDPATTTTRTWRAAPMTPRQTLRLTAGDVATTTPLDGTVTVALLRGTTVVATTTTTVTGPGDIVVDLPDAMTTVGSSPAAWADLSVRIALAAAA